MFGRMTYSISARPYCLAITAINCTQELTSVGKPRLILKLFPSAAFWAGCLAARKPGQQAASAAISEATGAIVDVGHIDYR